MNIELITVGKTKTRYVADGIDDYLKRLRRYINFSITEIPDIKNAGKLTQNQQKEEEGKLILSKITNSDYLMLLDERGRQYTSPAFAEHIDAIAATGRKCLKMVIGGPYGFSESVYKRADELLSLSKMTFNHEMVRLFITEQTYRAMTILRGEPYHHGG